MEEGNFIGRQSLKRLVFHLILVLAISFSGCTLERDPNLEGMEQVYVKRVVDGDTFITGEGDRVRLIGIDAPESAIPDTQPEAYGPEASAFLEELIEGETVYMEKDVSETDRYDRLLRYVYLSDGTFVNEYIVEEGYAVHVVYPPDVAYEKQLEEAQGRAMALDVGMWED